MPGPGDFSVEIKTIDFNGVETRGLGRVLAAVAGITDSDKIGKEMAENAAKAGKIVMEKAAPRGKPGTGSDFPEDAAVSSTSRRGDRPKLHERVVVARRGKAEWHPGGAGGGGHWEATFGVRSLPGVPADRDPAWYVFHGTGRRGDEHSSGSDILATPPGNLLTFMHDGVQVFTASVGGQIAQQLWVEQGRAAARVEIRKQMSEFRQRMRARSAIAARR